MSEGFIARMMAPESRCRQLDVLYDEIDGALLSGRFEDARAMLTAIAEADVPRAHVLSAILISEPWRDRFVEVRDALATKEQAMLFARGGP